MLIPLDLGLPWEREYERPATPGRILVRSVIQRGNRREREWEDFELDAYNPVIPDAGTIHVPGFAPGGHTLNDTQRGIIRTFARSATAKMPSTPVTQVMKINVYGHEDETGDPAHFQELGLKRAFAVRDLLKPFLQGLLDRMPSGDRREPLLILSDWGPYRPIRSNATAGGRWWNRRVDLRIRP